MRQEDELTGRKPVWEWITDTTLDEIDRAGYVVVDREMWERMTALSNAAYRFALGSEVNDGE